MGLMDIFAGKHKKLLADTKYILEEIDYRLLRVAWEEYVRLHHGESAEEMFKVTTPAWLALELVDNYEGKLTDLGPQEKKFITYLRNSPQTYTEVVQVLSQADYTDADGEYAFDAHHDLSEVITPDFAEYRTKELRNVLVAVAQTYQNMLADYIKKHDELLASAK